MLCELMKSNAQQVEYINFNAAGLSNSFGIYIRGCLKESQPYCYEAKRRLFICLDYVNHYLDEEKLVAVYIDIYDLENARNLAFQAMNADLRSGLIEKVLFADLEEIFKDSVLNNNILDLIEGVEGIEFFDVNGNIFEARKILVGQSLGV